MTAMHALTLPGLYQAEIQHELTRHPPRTDRLMTEKEVSRLPTPVGRFFRSSGFIGRPHTSNARIEWETFQLRRAPDAKWLSMRCEQLNAVAEPTRIAMMAGQIGGIIPLEGLDTYQDGQGSMRIKVAKLLWLGNAHGRYMDESALVTLLAESMFVPSLALQPYVHWHPLNMHCAGATLIHRGVSVHGTFHFNADDEFVRFDSDDRFRDGKFPERVAWSAMVDSYAQGPETRFPRDVRATWHEERGDFDYVRGRIASITFNVDR